jgi:Zn finger protein HypA/HybF involved in hydrogenase expression
MSAERSRDPIAEYDKLNSELLSLQTQFANQKMPQQEFELLSKQLKDRISAAEANLYLSARKDPSIAKRLRLRSYSEPTVQLIISHFVRTSGKPIEPEFGVDRFPKYPIANVGGEELSVERSLLQRLADIGGLTQSLYERVIYCPRCQKPSDIFMRYKCSQCGSINISISRMIEHITCGTIHQEGAFRLGRSMLCPTCKKLILNAEEYRLIGIVCSCNACQAHFENPTQSYYCRACKHDFDLLGAAIIDVFAYGMSGDALNEARESLGINDLTKTLSENGYEVTVPGVLTVSSKEVLFSLIAKKNSKVFAIDLVQSDSEVDVEPVLQLYVKLLEETTPVLAILAVVPTLSKRGREVAALHRLTVVEGSNAFEIGQRILNMLEVVLGLRR